MFRVISDEPLHLSNRTLLIPAVSVGAVSTLALDLLLNSHAHKKLAWVYTDYFLPFVGNSALDHSTSLSFPIELYELSAQLVVLQIRSLCRDPEGFTEKLLNWCKDSGITQIVLASSNWDEMKVNELEPDLFWVKNSSSQLAWDLDFKEFEQYKEYLKGAGLSKKIMKSEIPTNAVFVYGREVPADVPNAYKLAEGLGRVLGLSTQFTAPRSWQGILAS